MQHYMIVFWNGYVPETLGPYDKESRDKRSKEILKENKKNKFIFMDVEKGKDPIFYV